jgi:hypothetical protein
MRSERKQPYVAKVALKTCFPMERYFKNSRGSKKLRLERGCNLLILRSRSQRPAPFRKRLFL